MGVEDRGTPVRNARSVAVDSGIGGQDPPGFRAASPVVTDTGCCPSAADGAVVLSSERPRDFVRSG
jgi:hypothetical protein